METSGRPPLLDIKKPEEQNKTGQLFSKLEHMCAPHHLTCNVLDKEWRFTQGTHFN